MRSRLRVRDTHAHTRTLAPTPGITREWRSEKRCADPAERHCDVLVLPARGLGESELGTPCAGSWGVADLLRRLRETPPPPREDPRVPSAKGLAGASEGPGAGPGSTIHNRTHTGFRPGGVGDGGDVGSFARPHNRQHGASGRQGRRQGCGGDRPDLSSHKAGTFTLRDTVGGAQGALGTPQVLLQPGQKSA